MKHVTASEHVLQRGCNDNNACLVRRQTAGRKTLDTRQWNTSKTHPLQHVAQGAADTHVEVKEVRSLTRSSYSCVQQPQSVKQKPDHKNTAVDAACTHPWLAVTLAVGQTRCDCSDNG
jgi:hypothetical protein